MIALSFNELLHTHRAYQNNEINIVAIKAHHTHRTCQLMIFNFLCSPIIGHPVAIGRREVKQRDVSDRRNDCFAGADDKRVAEHLARRVRECDGKARAVFLEFSLAFSGKYTERISLAGWRARASKRNATYESYLSAQLFRAS